MNSNFSNNWKKVMRTNLYIPYDAINKIPIFPVKNDDVFDSLKERMAFIENLKTDKDITEFCKSILKGNKPLNELIIENRNNYKNLPFRIYIDLRNTTDTEYAIISTYAVDIWSHSCLYPLPYDGTGKVPYRIAESKETHDNRSKYPLLNKRMNSDFMMKAFGEFLGNAAVILYAITHPSETIIMNFNTGKRHIAGSSVKSDDEEFCISVIKAYQSHRGTAKATGTGTPHSHEYGVRGFWRHLKSGREIWVKPHQRCVGRGAENIHEYLIIKGKA